MLKISKGYFSTKDLENVDNVLIEAIKWVAAEYKYVVELKEDLEKITLQESHLDEDSRLLSHALTALRYVARSQRRVTRLEERAEKKFSKIINKLSKYTGENYNEYAKLIDTLNKHFAKLKIEHDSIIKYVSMYRGYLKHGLTTFEAQVQLLEEIKSEHSQKKSEHVLNACKASSKEIRKIVGDVYDWVVAMQVTMKKIRSTISDYDDTTEGAITYLKNYGFPIKKFKREAIFLAMHSNDIGDLERLFRNHGGNDLVRVLFAEVLPYSRNFLNENNWSLFYRWLREIVKNLSEEI